jgi:hypothetical protein
MVPDAHIPIRAMRQDNCDPTQAREAKARGALASASSPLEGSWEVVVKAKNCVTGVEVPPQLWSPAYQTFNAGGTMLEATSVPRFLPGQRGPGHGHWERTDLNTHEAAFQMSYVVFDPTDSARLDSNLQGRTAIDRSSRRAL